MIVLARISKGETNYPFGRHILLNLPIVNQMAEVFLETLQMNYPERPLINLICRGSSGAAVAALLANHLIEKGGYQVEIIHIKKDGESAHGSSPAIFHKGLACYVDDFISTGDTMRSINANYFEPPDFIVVSGSVSEYIIEKFKPKYLICSQYYGG